MLLQAYAATTGAGSYHKTALLSDALTALGRRKLAWTPEEALQVVQTATGAPWRYPHVALLGTDEAVAALARVQQKVKNRNIRKQIDRSLHEAAVLRYGQAFALMKGRDWTATALGYWDGGYEGTATKTFPGGRWRAAFFYDLVENEADHYGTPALCSTDQVRFQELVGNAWQTVPLDAVPPLVFSEAMRDVDLLVGVASIAADPTWADRGQDRHLDYWHHASFGDLTESAETRRAALERLLPRTRIADRVSLDGRFVRVRGQLRTYKIHIGSGNILMEPNDQYLCIVPSRDKGPDRIFLPFEEDGGRLSLIVSKAFLLADDVTITDPSILRQIQRT